MIEVDEPDENETKGKSIDFNSSGARPNTMESTYDKGYGSSDRTHTDNQALPLIKFGKSGATRYKGRNMI